MGFFAKDIGLDLGTSSTKICVEGRGIVVREPSVVAVDKNFGTVIAIRNGCKRNVWAYTRKYRDNKSS